MMLKKTAARFSILYIVLCWLLFHQAKAAPAGCSTKANEVLQTIRNEYNILDTSLPKPLPSDNDQSYPDICKDNIECPCEVTETKKNTNQIPSSLVTVECKKNKYNLCSGNCFPLKYNMEVLERDPKVNEEIGVTVWKRKLVSITMGYYKK